MVRESIKTLCLGFPWLGIMVKTLSFNAGGTSSIPGRGAWIPQAKKKNTPRHKTEKQYCNKFNKDLKMDHIEKNLKKENQKLSARGGWKGEADFMWHGLPWVE